MFASLPNSPVTGPTSRLYAMFPFAPPVSPPWTSSTSSYFARIKSVSSSSTSTPDLAPNSNATIDELTAWSERMKFERSSRLALDERHPTVLASLRKPFADGEQVEMRASFGHIVWPLSISSGKVGETGLVPVLEGRWPFPKFAKWSQLQTAFRSVFLPRYASSQRCHPSFSPNREYK